MDVHFEPTVGRYVYSNKSSKSSYVAQPDHNCPGCGSPIYDKKPVCGKCFKAGLYPKSKWKANRE